IIGRAEGTGSTVNVSIDPQNPGTTVKLVITGQDYYIYEQDLDVVPAGGAFIAYAYTDTITGGYDNGQLNAGCIYDLTAAVANWGGDMAYGVEGIMTSTDGYITMEYDTVTYGNIAANDTVVGTSPHGFQLGSAIPDGYIIPVDMTCWDNNDSSWTSSFNLTVNAPEAEVIGYWGPEAIGAGDVFDLGIKLYNGGSGTGYNTNASISSSDAYITINDSTVSVGNFAPGDTFFDRNAFNITVDPSCPDPHFAEVVLSVSMDGGYQLCDTVSIGIGSLIFVEDFESKDTADWTYEGTYSWHVSTRRAHSTTHSMYVGDENTGVHANGLVNVRAVSPVFYVGAGTEMTFWHWYNTYDTWDGTQLQLTTNGGTTWVTIETDEGYTSVNQGSGNGFNSGEEYWAGVHEAWEIQHYTFTITDSVQLGWKFGSTSVVAYEGYYFDDINCGVSSGLGIEEEQTGPPSVNTYQFRLAPAYPNPMQGRAVIAYSVASEGPVSIKVYDISGREVSTLINQVQGPGSYRIEWDGRDNHGTMVSSGTYFYRMTAGSFSDGKKLVVVR
ncbi:MAG: T9SS type A sorting domain-containing protein, partial [bacterium]